MCYGCSYTPDFNFYDCCSMHDIDYDKGGTKQERKKADQYLRDCIKAHGHPYKAYIYYMGVRLFGWMFFNKK
jgi:hypothetical protein